MVSRFQRQSYIVLCQAVRVLVTVFEILRFKHLTLSRAEGHFAPLPQGTKKPQGTYQKNKLLSAANQIITFSPAVFKYNELVGEGTGQSFSYSRHGNSTPVLIGAVLLHVALCCGGNSGPGTQRLLALLASVVRTGLSRDKFVQETDRLSPQQQDE
jgi:hypothetical protein